MVGYHVFSEFYDRLMADVDYNGRADYLLRLFERYGTRPQTVLDIACGSGSLCEAFVHRGIDPIGIDASGEISSDARQQVEALLKRSFRPEFLNRLDEIVFYKPLTRENITAIIDLQIAALNRRLADKQLTCTLTDAAKHHIIDASYDPQFGARPMRRYVQHTVETLIARRILEGTILPGAELTVDVQDGELHVS